MQMNCLNFHHRHNTEMFNCVIPSFHKGNGYSMTCPCRHRGRQYSSNPFATWHLEVGGQYHTLAALLPEKGLVPIFRRWVVQKTHPHGDSILRLPSLQHVTIPTKLSPTEVIVRQNTFTSIMLVFTYHLSMSKENNANCRNKEKKLSRKLCKCLMSYVCKGKWCNDLHLPASSILS